MGQIKRRCNANANFANSAASKITVNLFSLKHRNPLGSTEATPDTSAEASLVGVNIIQRLGIDLVNLMPPSQDTLSAVNRQTVTCVGTFPCIIEYCGRFVEETIYVCPEVENFLLAWYVCQQVNILPDTYPQPINSSKTPRKLASILKAENTRFIISENPTEPEDIINVDTTRMIRKNVSAILRGKDPEITKEIFIDPMLEDLKESTQQDEVAQQLITAIKSNFSKGNKCPLAQPFKKLKDKLTFEDGLILLNSHRIVVPVQKRKEIPTKLHASHQGIERTKQRARQIVYWPGINSDIKNTVEACTKCQEHQPSLQQEPLQRDPLPSRPFEDVSAHLFYYAGKTYLVYVDRLSGWIKLSEFSHNPSSHQIISTIRKFFVDAEVPVRIRTDGGP